jgi:hypothetical protein
MSAMTPSESPATRNVHSEEIELQSTQDLRNADADVGEAINGGTKLTRMNLLRVIAASISFFFAGNNDGSLGALTPYILRTYSVGTEYVALM